MKESMYERIEKHGNDLNRIFDTGLDNVTLCNKLRRLEAQGERIATDYRNGDITEVDFDSLEKQLMDKVYYVLNNGNFGEDRPHKRGVPVFLNGDPRGYALKINDDYVRLLEKQGKTIHRDMGGYGIIAPDLTNN